MSKEIMGRQGNSRSSIEKALAVLDSFLPYNTAASTTELSQRLGYHKATVSRILLTLARNGYLRQDRQSKKYMLGPGVLRLGNSVLRSLQADLTPIVQPYIDALRDSVGETAAYETFTGSFSAMAYVANASNPVRVAAEVGQALPNHAAAGSKSILAFSPPDVVAQCLRGDLPPYTPNTIVDIGEFQRLLAEIRQQGYATDIGEIEVGINAVAVPVFNHLDSAVGAVVVIGPAARVPGPQQALLISQLKETAGKISSRLFHEERTVG